jgi:DNA repair photolyase
MRSIRAGAASIKDRIKAVHEAHEQGIPTWVSLAPVIEPDQALQVIQELHPIGDHWKVGKINHWPEIERRHTWLKFRTEVEEVLDDLSADYYLKDSLTKLK